MVCSPRSASVSTGVYDFTWIGGSFEVELRTDGVFFCKKFPADARWSFDDETLEIDWCQFGQYVLKAQGDELVGGAKGNEANWRTARFKRAFTPQEELLSASAWMLHHPTGPPFRVEFHADGRFVSPSFPGAFSYTLKDDAVAVEWGLYGSYVFKLDVASKEMAGACRGNAASWRRLEFVESLPAFMPPQTCSKGCCVVLGTDNAACSKYGGRKRGMLRLEDEDKMQQAFDRQCAMLTR
eukprot:1061182-Prymnesium_polylepis.1